MLPAMNEPQKISVVIIAKNAEGTIEKVISSCKKVSDDIIILDSHSTDATAQIAKAHECMHIDLDWKGFGPTKNQGHQLAKNDWILSIDSDEILSDELAESILKLNKNPHEIYLLDRMSYIGATPVKHSGWYPDWIPRLFHRETARWNDRKVHETLIFPKETKLIKLQGKLHHYSYQSIDQLTQKMDRYARLGAEEWQAKGKNVHWLYQKMAPTFRFLRAYLWKMGILDGDIGRAIAQSEAEMVRKRIEYYMRAKKEIGQ
jgi:glycosyltransferase involved in cell wall biosynthesis